ncbi:MAG: citryl-CoA lyase, partial [Pseudomonadota bacterium]
GELPTKAQATLLEAALMAAVDHGPQAPSIAIARMAATCGVGLQSAMASGLNTLGDVHGGAGEAAVRLYEAVAEHDSPGDGAATELDRFFAAGESFVPGFGHRFHPIDPRAPRLMELVDSAVTDGTVAGRHLAAARGIEAALAQRKGKHIPMNIDGATAVIFAELGFPAPLARGLFSLSRAVGLLAHAWEQSEQGGRNKGPIPRDTIWTYTGPPPRKLPDR